jgi:enoyl-CoA hydratase
MSFKYQNLELDQTDGIATITINRPKYLNALNAQTIGELNNFFKRDFKHIDELKGVILTGAGDKSFVAGADITEFDSLSAEEGRKFAKEGLDTFFLIENFHKPVIAAVNGFALGGGCELAMACHLRIANENAKFGQPEVNLALIPGYGGTQRLIHLIGKGRALELLMTGAMIDADKALNYGLVNHTTTSEELIPFTKKMITKISTKGPIAISKIIESVNAFFEPSKNGYEVENMNFGVTIGTEDSREGAKAFMEKRKAVFTGK